MTNTMNLRMKTISLNIDESLIIPLIELFENPTGKIVEGLMKSKMVHRHLAERIIKETKVTANGMKYN